jgi:hypothetical protein
MKSTWLRPFSILLLGSAAVLVVQDLSAQTFAYNYRDLVLSFRKVQRNGGTRGQYDFEVNLGPVTNYLNLQPGAVKTITEFSSSQLSAVFDSLNNLSWSVSAGNPSSSSGMPLNTLWVTSGRVTDLAQPEANPPATGSVSSQSLARSQVLSIGSNAQQYSGTPDLVYNTPTAVRVPEGSGFEYSAYVGAGGDLNGTFWRDIENTTPTGFAGSAGVSRSDLYELKTSSPGAPATRIGVFELHPDGSIVFQRAGGTSPAVPPAPVVTLARSGDISTISFATTNGFNYSLRFTNNAGLAAPVSTWPMRPNVAVGNGSIQSVTDQTTDRDRVYRVEVQ